MNEEPNPYDGHGAPAPETPSRSQVQRNLSIVRRHIWVVVAVFVVVATLGLIRAYKATPIYSATAKILVEREVPRATHFQGVMSGIPSWGPEYYRTQVGLVRSRAVLELALEDPEVAELFEEVSTEPRKLSVIARLKRTVPALLGIPPSRPAERWERLRGFVSAKHIADTHFVHVNVESANEKRAAKLANKVAAAFVQYHVKRRLEISNDIFLYLKEQKDREELALTEANDKLQEFREQTSNSTLKSADFAHPVLERLSVLANELTETQLKRIGAEAHYRVAMQALHAGDDALRGDNDQLFSIPQLIDGTTAAGIRDALMSAEQERVAMSETYGPLHPRMQAIDARIDHLKGKLADSLEEVVHSITTELELLAEEEKELQRQHDLQNRMALDLAKETLVFQRLQHDVERHQKLLSVLVQRMSEVELTSDYTKTNVEVIERASIPKAPVRPDKRRMASMALLFGLVLGVGMAFVLERLDDTVRTPEDLEVDIGLPVLGFVPEIRVKGEGVRDSAYRSLVTALEPSSSAIEAYRNIRTSLFFSAPAEEARVLLVTSAGPGEGKTTTATNLAMVIAQSGKRVCLVDADFRRPKVHHVFGLSDEVGFSSVLVGEAKLEDAVQKTVHDIEHIDNLDILAAGPKPPNPTELFETRSAHQLFDELRRKYDRVIVDTPPTLFVSDTCILSTICDGIVLIARSEKTKGASVMRARKQLEGVEARIIGSVLNGVNSSRMNHYYSDYYHHGYARYYRDYYSSYYSDRKDDKDRSGTKAGV